MTVAADIVTAITGHHAELEQSLATAVDSVVSATRAGSPDDVVVTQLRQLLLHEIIPHARAEEEVLYAAAANSMGPLVTGMIFEHETLMGLADRLAAVTTAVDAATTAFALQAVFAGHVRRENELLLPALAARSDVDLPALLPAMQERFAAYQAAAA